MQYALPLMLYGGLAALALAVTWRDEELRWIGFWLVAGFILSNALYFAHIPPVKRTGPYTFIEIMVAVAAFWSLTRHSRWPVAIIVCNLLSIAANIALLLYFPPSRQQIYAWNVATNVLFAAECLLAFGAGGGYGIVADYLRRRLPGGRPASALGAHRKDAP